MKRARPIIRKKALNRGAPIKAKRRKTTPARQASQGKPCQVRVPGYCLPTNETVVLAHYRLDTGGGQKPDDEQAADACQACHDIVDGRLRVAHTFTHPEIRLMHAEGVLRTQQSRRDAWEMEKFP
jgi:hypothetical protein